MKILHFVIDDKFIPLIQSLYEEAFPGANAFRVWQVIERPFSFIKEGPSVKKVSANYFRSKELRDESMNFDLLVVHSLREIFTDGIKTVRPDLFIVWCGWGFDYYSFLRSEIGNLTLKETLRMEKQAFHKPLRKRLFASARSVKQHLKSLFSGKPSKEKKNLASVAKRINVFSVLPTEVPMLKKSLPDLPSVSIALFYYTTEDVFEKGPDRMNGPDILLGNSPAPTNNHVEILKTLHRILPANRNIIAPLSYGDKFKPYAQLLCELGSRLFGDRFKPLLAWMPIDEYHTSLQNCGIVIMNHRRQQALGTISAALYKGAKVFLRPENPVYRWYSEMGVTVFNIHELSSPQASTFELLSEDAARKNKEIVGTFWSRKNAVQGIQDLQTFVNKPRLSK